MSEMKVESFAEGKWVPGQGDQVPLYNAVNGELVGEASSQGVDFKGMLDYARRVGGSNLRSLTFHQRADMLKSIARCLIEHKEELYRISAATGATKTDSWMDIDGGIGTLSVYASKGRKELPDDTIYLDEPAEILSRKGTFIGRHVCLPLQGTAVHINAFNFPCWGMLEKLAPSLLAGMPAIVKPATLTCYLTEKIVKVIIDSGILPEGALQLICGGVGDLLDHVTGQDAVTFTGSAATGRTLRSHPRIIGESVRFNAEADSLNCSILGSDVDTDSEEFGLFVREVAREMTIKAGQKCTAIRRAIVPRAQSAAVIEALQTRLSAIPVGDPAVEGVRMGPLAGKVQAREVARRLSELQTEAELVYGDPDHFEVVGADPEKGAFFPTTLLYCDQPLSQTAPHNVEAFGPVSTVMPYDSVDEAVELAALGKGSLVGSLFTADDSLAREIVTGIAPHHGRLMIINRHCAAESTGHGAALPQLVHGGPGRAGGGEELGGIRAVFHFMQRTALQGSPDTLARISVKS